ncbi:MAG: hypothetical protein ACK5VW_01845 [Holosporales bacterium]
MTSIKPIKGLKAVTLGLSLSVSGLAFASDLALTQDDTVSTRVAVTNPVYPKENLFIANKNFAEMEEVVRRANQGDLDAFSTLAEYHVHRALNRRLLNQVNFESLSSDLSSWILEDFNRGLLVVDAFKNNLLEKSLLEVVESRAASHQDASALALRGRLYRLGLIAQDQSPAIRLPLALADFEKAAQLGHGYAALEACKIYDIQALAKKGAAYSEVVRKKIALLADHAHQDYAPALVEQGLVHLQNNHLESAKKSFLKAGNLGSAEGRYQVARMYEKFQITKSLRDESPMTYTDALKVAKAWYLGAAAKGHELAAEALEKLNFPLQYGHQGHDGLGQIWTFRNMVQSNDPEALKHLFVKTIQDKNLTDASSYGYSMHFLEKIWDNLEWMKKDFLGQSKLTYFEKLPMLNTLKKVSTAVSGIIKKLQDLTATPGCMISYLELSERFKSQDFLRSNQDVVRVIQLCHGGSTREVVSLGADAVNATNAVLEMFNPAHETWKGLLNSLDGMGDLIRQTELQCISALIERDSLRPSLSVEEENSRKAELNHRMLILIHQRDLLQFLDQLPQKMLSLVWDQQPLRDMVFAEQNAWTNQLPVVAPQSASAAPVAHESFFNVPPILNCEKLVASIPQMMARPSSYELKHVFKFDQDDYADPQHAEPGPLVENLQELKKFYQSLQLINAQGGDEASLGHELTMGHLKPLWNLVTATEDLVHQMNKTCSNGVAGLMVTVLQPNAPYEALFRGEHDELDAYYTRKAGRIFSLRSYGKESVALSRQIWSIVLGTHPLWLAAQDSLKVLKSELETVKAVQLLLQEDMVHAIDSENVDDQVRIQALLEKEERHLKKLQATQHIFNSWSSQVYHHVMSGLNERNEKFIRDNDWIRDLEHATHVKH